MDLEQVIYEKEDNIGIITLNRPEKLNCFTHRLIGEVIHLLEEADRDDEVRALIIKGAGRAFSSGDDMKDMGEQPEHVPGTAAEGLLYHGYHALVLAVRHTKKPIVACVHGYALGAGFELALACDIVVAADNARFGAVLMTRGMVGAPYLLTRLLGINRASELIFTGRTFSAKEAASLGMVNRLVPEDRVEAETKEFASQLARMPTKAIGMAKMAINKALGQDLESGIEYQGLALHWSQRTEDFQEGTNAFFEKREARFKGR